MISEERLQFNLQYVDKMRKFVQGHGVRCNLDNPETIQEKLMWLNIYDADPLKSDCADKLKVKEYVRRVLGKDISVPTLKVWDKPDEIDFDELPQQFVLKCNHGSGMNIIVHDKNLEDFVNDISRLSHWMNDDFSMRNGFESHYHWIERKMFAEEIIGEGNGELRDYKFWCFNGNPRFYTINDGNGHGQWMKFYDMNQNLLDFKRRDFMYEPDFEIEQPKSFETMKQYATKLSSVFKFVRIDFYELDSKIYLGEFTFTPGAFFFKFVNPDDDIKIGNMLEI